MSPEVDILRKKFFISCSLGVVSIFLILWYVTNIYVAIGGMVAYCSTFYAILIAIIVRDIDKNPRRYGHG
jgi:hypothetical protein